MNARRFLVLSIFTLLISAPVFSAPWRIMPVGNSITLGRKDEIAPYNGFRDYLYTYLQTNLAEGFEFVGSDGEDPVRGFFQPGAKIADFFSGSGNKDLTAEIALQRPDMLLIHLGTNNAEDPVGNYAGGGGTANQMYNLLNEALNAMGLYAGRPDWRIVVFKIIPKYDNGFEITNVRAFNKQLEEMMFSGGLINDPITLADMYSILTMDNFDIDGIHPNDSGYDLMARLYAGIIRGGGSTDGIVSPDNTSPATITGFQAEKANDETARLTWIAPGDNGSSGKATLYELRYSTDSQLLQATPSTGELYSLARPEGAGTLESRFLSLASGSRYYFRLRAYDEHNNAGGWSALASADLTLSAGGNVVSDSFIVDTNWNYDPAYQIGGGRLYNASTNRWNDMAIFTGASYSSDANFVETSITWSNDADANSRYTGVAMLLDSADPSSADGYMIRLDPSKNTIDLYRINNGAFQFDTSSVVALSSGPVAGDELSVRFTHDITGYIFQVSLNNSYLGQLRDSNPVLLPADSYHSGVILYGAPDGQNNSLSRFSVEIPVGKPTTLAIVSGDSTSSRVNEALALPLKVKVSDINGFGVKNIPLEFSAISDNISLSTEYDKLAQTFNGDIWIEAEDGILESPMSPASSPEASEGAFILGQGANREGYAHYKLLVPRAGSYKVWVRGAGPDDNSNSCFVGFDLADETNIIKFSNDGTWGWQPSITQSLPAGIVDFYVKTREARTQIDKFLITANASIPVGKGNTNQTFPNLTDQFGFAYSEATFGPSSGWYEITATTDLIPVGGQVTFRVNALPGDPASMAAESPLRIAGSYLSSLAQPFQVKLLDQYGNPARRTPVTFRIAAGSGYFGTNSSNTEINVKSDPQGIAEATLTLGTDSLTQVEAFVASNPGLGKIFFEGVIETVASNFEILGDQRPQGTVGRPLAQPLSVVVRDGQQSPVTNYLVQFSVIAGNGTVANDTLSANSVMVRSGSDGIASINYTLGDTAGAGKNRVRASSGFSSLDFEIIAMPDAATSLILSGDNQQQYAGQTFADSLRAKVADQYGNGISGHTLQFTVQQGDGNFDGLTGTSISNASKTATTNSQGIAAVSYTAGKTTGIHIIQVVDQNSSIPQKQFSNIQVNETTVSQIEKIPGDNRSGTVKEWLSDSLKVRLTDPFNSSVADIRVVFESLEPQDNPGQFINGTTYSTKSRSDGTAAARFKFGEKAVTHKVRVSTPDVADVAPVEFTLWANAGSAAKLLLSQGANFLGVAGQDTALLELQVLDRYNNPVADQYVLFNIETGGGRFRDDIAADTTDVEGYARINYLLGQKAGLVTINAYVDALTPASFHGTINAGPAEVVENKTASIPEGIVNTELTTPFQIILKDRFGNAVPNAQFVCRVLSQGGAVTGDSVKFTDSKGSAVFGYRLGRQAGVKSDTVRIVLPSKPEIIFELYATAHPGPAAVVTSDTTHWGPLRLGAIPIVLQPKVRVSDSYGNPVSGHKIKFYIDETTVLSQTVTNDSGIATYRWTLEAKPDSQVIYAASDNSNTAPLAGEPVAFSAVTTAGPAYRIEAVAGSAFEGPSWLKVRVVDINTVAVSGYAVTFTSNLQGKFIAGSDTSFKQIQVPTDNNGLAKVYYEPLIGNNIISTSSSNPDLTGPNFLVKGMPATATRIALFNTAPSISDTVNRDVRIQVAAFDNNSLPAAGQTISFEIVSGNGTLNGNGSKTQQSTGSDGIASIQWRLGTKAGSNSDRLNIAAERDGVQLANSPFFVTATTIAAKAFPDSSQVITQAGVAGVNTQVVVKLKDMYGNPAASRGLEMIEHQYLNLTAPIPETDQNGETVVRLYSNKAGTFEFILQTTGEAGVRLNPARIEIKPAAAARLQKISGDKQKANPGAVLKEPFVAKTTDIFDNPVPFANVTFSSSKGRFMANNLNSVTVQSDSNGTAAAGMIANNEPGTAFEVSARIAGASGEPVIFTGNINSDITTVYFKVSTDTLTGKPGDEVGPFSLTIVDGDSVPVWNRTITLTLDPQSGGQLANSSLQSDAFGKIEFNYIIGNKKQIQQITAQDAASGLTAEFFARTAIGGPDNVIALQPEDIVEVTDDVELVAIVIDSLGVGVPGIAVQFKLTGDETYNARFLEETTRHTDKDGRAKILFKTGEKAASYIIYATSPELPGKLATIVVKTKHKWPSRLAELNNYRFGKTMTVGRPLLEPITIRVTDEYENPVENVILAFWANSGNGSFANYEFDPKFFITKTGVDGTGSSTWLLGKVGENSIEVTATYLGNALPQPLTVTATGVENNFPEFDNVPEDTVTIDYTPYYDSPSEYSRTIKATDLDGDPIEYTVETKPSSADYDVATNVFKWKPGPRDKSKIWPLRIIARDNKLGIEQGTGIYEAFFRVVGNMPPQVTPIPAETATIRIQPGTSQTFSVEASDPDDDPLTFRWELKGVVFASGPTATTFTLRYQDVAEDFYDLTCFVSDSAGNEVAVTWSFIKVKVELSRFEANASPYEGIVVDWHTVQEEDNLGFNLLRSTKEKGRYQKINKELLPPQKTGFYSFIDSTAEAGVRHFYKLQDVNKFGFKSEHGPISVILSAPTKFDMSQNYPNPFNPETRIRYQLPKTVATQIKIYNISGQEVRTLVDGTVKAGWHVVRWDGRNDNNLRVGSGIYYYRIIAGDYTAIKKMVLIH